MWTISHIKNISPVSWWEDEVPTEADPLKSLAIRILQINVSAMDVERKNSHAKLIKSCNRVRMSRKNHERATRYFANIRMMDAIHSADYEEKYAAWSSDSSAKSDANGSDSDDGIFTVDHA